MRAVIIEGFFTVATMEVVEMMMGASLMRKGVLSRRLLWERKERDRLEEMRERVKVRKGKREKENNGSF